MTKNEKDKLVESVKLFSQLPPSMQDVLMAGFDLGKAATEAKKEKE